MPQFKLTAPHYLPDGSGHFVIVESGTVVGDGTPIPYKGKPSLNMEGVDEAGKKLVEARMKNVLLPVESLPTKLGEG